MEKKIEQNVEWREVTLGNGGKITLGLDDGIFTLVFTKMEGTAMIQTQIKLSHEAMRALVFLYMEKLQLDSDGTLKKGA